jgi:tripartite-type tricarboxylate transporter receptor subunit TctC
MMRVRRKAIAPAAVVASLLGAAFAGAAHAQDAGSFYAGRNVSIIVGFGPGGGYDLYARLLARYYGPNIPGKPNVIVQNMPGAGGVNAANFVYNTAAKDGTVIAGVNQGAALFQQLGGKGAQYDASKFRWIGRMASSNNVAYTWAASGVRTIADAKSREVIMAGSGVISDANIYPNVMNGLLGTRFKIINGYAGTNESNLALERGEVQGRGGGSYSSLQTTRPQWLKDGSISLLVQIGLEKEPDLPNVPRLLDLVTSEQDRQIAMLVTLPVEIGYNYWLAPEVPLDRVSLLRNSFEATMKDPALLAEAKKISLDIRYKSGAELERMVADAAKTPPEVLKRAAQILGW